MRSLWILMLILNVVCITASAEFRGQLLTYSQLDHLAPAKRIAYLEELRELVILLEKKDNEIIAAGEVSKLKNQVADLLEMFAAVPQAEAAAAVNLRAPPRPPAVRADTSLTTPPSAPAPTACVLPAIDCAKVGTAEREEFEKQFRMDKSDDANVCISGGFFSKYPYAKKGKGKCDIVREYPPHSKNPQIPRCPAGSALCNPVMFCLGTNVTNPQDSAQKAIRPLTKCVEYGPKAGYDITNRCDVWYNTLKNKPVDDHGELAGAALNVAKTAIAVPCDPVKVPFVGLTEVWNNLRKDFNKYYNTRCLADERFKSMFCTECNVMAKHVFEMNGKAAGSGCVTPPEPPVSPKPVATPTPDSTST